MAKLKHDPSAVNISNRKAYFLYHVLEKTEAGIELFGTEVKSLRAGGGSLNESYALVRHGELWLEGFHIPPYSHGNLYNKIPDRPRKLLVHRKELLKMNEEVSQKGLTMVPLRIYMNARGKVKVELALCKGKKEYDKRDSIRERDLDREADRAMKDHGRGRRFED